MTSRCPVCRERLADGDCAPCQRATLLYDKLLDDRSTSDGDYVFHEVAHFIVLFRRRPRTKFDFSYLISDTIGMFPIGIAQVHEMRTIALQCVTYARLGWRPSVARMVDLSWPGLRDVDGLVDRWDHGRRIIETETQARSYVRKLIPRTSAQNVRLYTNALLEMRQQGSKVRA
jgi:hypothetical protein